MMEARRLEKQRRESAKSKAASQLPSCQEQEFNLRLVDLYREQPCLWNTSLAEHGDAERKRRAWEEIAGKMGSHLSASFVRCRMRSMRYKLNVYQLQLIEYQMTPGMGVPPEKPYFVDRFRFLDGVSADSTGPSPGVSAPKTPLVTERGRLGNLWSSFSLKKTLAASSKTTKEAPAARRSGPSIAAIVKERLENQLIPLEFTMPRLPVTRQQHHLIGAGIPGPSSSASSLALSDTPPELRARPGESISVTKLARKRQQQQQLGGDIEKPATSRAAQAGSREYVQSEDEELYSLHWSMRRERRSRRPGQDKAPSQPASLRFGPANEPNPDIF